MEEEGEMSLSELDARAQKKPKDAISEKSPGVIIPPGTSIEDLPMVKSQGGRHLQVRAKETDALTEKDYEVLSLMACGVEKTVIANIAGCHRMTLHKMLDSKRTHRFTEATKKRIQALAPLAAEIIHSELVKGNVEVAQQVLKGLSIMKTSVNSGENRVKIRSMAEEIIDSQGKRIRRVTKESETERDIDG